MCMCMCVCACPVHVWRVWCAVLQCGFLLRWLVFKGEDTVIHATLRYPTLALEAAAVVVVVVAAAVVAMVAALAVCVETGGMVVLCMVLLQSSERALSHYTCKCIPVHPPLAGCSRMWYVRTVAFGRVLG